MPRRTNKTLILFSIKISLLNMEHKHWCTFVHTPCDVKQLMVFDVRCIVLRLSFGKYFFFNTFGDIKLSECCNMLMTCAAYECTNQFGFGKLSLQSRETATSDRSQRASNVTRSRLKQCDDSYRQRCLRSQICKVCSSKIVFGFTIVHI